MSPVCFDNFFAIGTVITSPNYPRSYRSNYRNTKTLRAALGKVLTFQFTAFNLEAEDSCDFDYLRITDGDGTVLMDKECGSSLPPTIRSRSNVVHVFFKTDGSQERSGWRIIYAEN